MRILVTGGTGFVGSRIVDRLKPVHDVVLLERDASGHHAPEGVSSLVGDVTDAASLAGKLVGFDVVIHLVAIIEEHGGATFDGVIRQGTENIVAAARAAGVPRFIHMSAIGVKDDPAYPYHQAKWKAEQAVMSSGLEWTIFRPSVIFGKGDGFVTVLAGVVRQFPITPIAGSGDARFQPVWVDDVADCFMRAVDDPDFTDGQVYELGGGKHYTYEQMIDAIARQLGVKRPRVHIPLPVMKAVVAASGPLPMALRPPVTSEQLKMLSLDNTAAGSATGELIGREPVALEDGIGYLTA
ncbi:MAG: complex I NDUFA9 subunit family protein [Thermomicrobiales bacterium]